LRIFDSLEEFDEFIDTYFNPKIIDKELIITTLIYPELSEK